MSVSYPQGLRALEPGFVNRVVPDDPHFSSGNSRPSELGNLALQSTLVGLTSAYIVSSRSERALECGYRKLCRWTCCLLSFSTRLRRRPKHSQFDSNVGAITARSITGASSTLGSQLLRIDSQLVISLRRDDAVRKNSWSPAK